MIKDTRTEEFILRIYIDAAKHVFCSARFSRKGGAFTAAVSLDLIHRSVA
jgi:hypothetical protein